MVEGTCQKATYRGAPLEVDHTPRCAMANLFLHQASYAHTIYQLEAQQPNAERATPGSPLRFDPAERTPEGQEEGATHIRDCQPALASLLWLVTRTRPDAAWAYSLAPSMAIRDPKAEAVRARRMLGDLKTTGDIWPMLVRNKLQGDMEEMRALADANFAPKQVLLRMRQRDACRRDLDRLEVKKTDHRHRPEPTRWSRCCFCCGGCWVQLSGRPKQPATSGG